MELINYSEFNTLTACERKFVYAYLLNMPEEGPKRGLHLGTLCHLWHGRWLERKGATLPEVWEDDINTGGKPGEIRSVHLADFEPELVQRARWLAERFERVYGLEPPSSWHVISAEEWMTRQFDWGTLVGRSDGLVEIDGVLTLIEVKSYASKPGPLAYAQVSPQLGCYSLLAEEKFGKRPDFILYQGIHTYEWKLTRPTQSSLIEQCEAANIMPPGLTTKKTKTDWAREALATGAYDYQAHAPEDSFQQLEVELGDDHLRTAEAYLEAAVRRRDAILNSQSGAERGPRLSLAEALPSVGAQCSYCSFRPQCWNDLGGVEEFEIEVEDEDAEPV